MYQFTHPYVYERHIADKDLNESVRCVLAGHAMPAQKLNQLGAEQEKRSFVNKVIYNVAINVSSQQLSRFCQTLNLNYTEELTNLEMNMIDETIMRDQKAAGALSLYVIKRALQEESSDYLLKKALFVQNLREIAVSHLAHIGANSENTRIANAFQSAMKDKQQAVDLFNQYRR